VIEPGSVVRLTKQDAALGPRMTDLIIGEAQGVVVKEHPKLKQWWFVKWDTKRDGALEEAHPTSELCEASAVDRLADLMDDA
jgi:hypothetical protein